jgi:hypothetical protein
LGRGGGRGLRAVEWVYWAPTGAWVFVYLDGFCGLGEDSHRVQICAEVVKFYYFYYIIIVIIIIVIIIIVIILAWIYSTPSIKFVKSYTILRLYIFKKMLSMS